MAIKVCWKCGAEKTVQPHADNKKSTWLCMKCHGPRTIHELKPSCKHVLRVMSVTQFLRAA